MNRPPHLPKDSRFKSALLVCARLFLFAGALALAVWGAVSVYSTVGAAYDNWAFEQSQIRQKEAKAASVRQSSARMRAAQKSPASRRQSSVAANRVDSAGKKTLKQGSRIARLRIPSVGLSVMVLDGTREWVLQRGAGHIEGTAYPGEKGNMAIAGHRDRSFRKLKDVTRNDTIVVETPGGTYRYRVDDIAIVQPTEVSVLKATAKPTLTLVTCYPFYYVGHAPKRYIIKAQLVSGLAAETGPLRKSANSE